MVWNIVDATNMVGLFYSKISAAYRINEDNKVNGISNIKLGL